MDRKDRSAAVITLGCPKSAVSSDFIKGALVDSGYKLVTPAKAHAVVVNTCAFIDAAKEEAIETIMEVGKLKERGLVSLVVAGCMPQRYGKELESLMPEVDGWVGVDSPAKVVRVVNSTLSAKAGVGLGESPTGQIWDGRRLTQGPSAYLQIADGCSRGCTFCAIPAIRGPYRSRPPGDILREAADLVSAGVRELVLVAQDTGAYGQDLRQGAVSRHSLADLMLDLAGTPGLDWLRVMYLEPGAVDRRLLGAFEHPKVCSYFDLPIQHSSPRILRAMNRGVAVQDYLALLAKIRSMGPAAVRSSVIVGFPGETASDFAHLTDFIAEAGLDSLAVFEYSTEEGTEAAVMGRQTPRTTRRRRYHDLVALQDHLAEESIRRWVGREVSVLVEERRDGCSVGRTMWQAPEIDGETRIGGSLEVGGLAQATVIDTDGYDLIAEVRPSG